MSVNAAEVEEMLFKLFDKATKINSMSLNDIDWEANLHIIDLIAKQPDRFSEFITRLIRKRLKDFYEQPLVLWRTLILLEMCVKNCGLSFHRAICNKEFIQVILKTGGKRINKPWLKRTPTSAKALAKDRVQEKVAQLIQAWGPLHPNELKLFNETFYKLQKAGVRFPSPSQEDLLPLTDLKRSEKLKKSAADVQIPSTLKTFLNECKTTISLLESILEQGAENLRNNGLANELYIDCKEQKRSRLLKLIEELGPSDEDDEKLYNTLLILLERLDLVVSEYDMLSAAISNSSYTADDDLSEDGLDDEEDEQTNASESASSFSEYKSSSTSSFAKGPIDLGLDFLEQITSKTKKQEKPKEQDNDFLAWLLKDVPNKLSYSSNRAKANYYYNPFEE